MNKVYLGMLAVLACATLCAGQVDNGKAKPVSSGSDKAVRTALVSGTSISAELQKTLDVNNARVGDEVALKTTQSIRHNGEIVVPKGSTLIGRITDVQRRTKQNSESRLGIVFDRIQRGNLSLPLSAGIVSITSAAGRMAVDDSLMTDVSSSSQTSASTSRQSSGGGLLGGVGHTVGGVVNTTTQTVGTVTNTAGQALGSAAGTTKRTVNGLSISVEASGSTNSTTTLSSPNKNLRFEKGSTFYLRAGN